MIAAAPVSSPLGAARLHPAGSLLDPGLATQLRNYRRRALTGVFTVSPAELTSFLPPGAAHASPLPGGSPWFLVFEQGHAALASAAGQVISGDLPVLREAASLAARSRGRTVVAGELVAGGQPLEALLQAGPQAETDRLSFVGLDLLVGGDDRARMPIGAFEERVPVLRRLLDGADHLKVARVDKVGSPDAVAALYREVVDVQHARGLLLRSDEGRLLKVMPALSVHATVVGFTERSKGEVGALLLALRRPSGAFQIIDLCSQLGESDTRKKFFHVLSPMAIASAYRHPGHHGEMVRFVRPEVSVEVRANDATADDSLGRHLQSMAISLEGGAWAPLRMAATAHLVAPRVIRMLQTHEAARALMGLAQLADRCWIDDLAAPITRPSLGASQIVRREAWVKVTRGKKAVRKLVAWKTNKEKADPSYPAYVVHWADYSPARREPLVREVHPAPSADAMNALADRLVAEHIKKGWQRA